MPEDKKKPGRPKKVAEFYEGPEAMERFEDGIKKILSLSKEEITEIKKSPKKKG